MGKVPFTGNGSKRALLDEDIEKSQCEQHPAGHYVQKADGSDACLFIYEGDGPVKDLEVENITPEGVKVRDKNTGETETLEV